MSRREAAVPLVSIVICAHQDSHELEKTLRSAENANGNFEAELIVVSPIPERLMRKYGPKHQKNTHFIPDPEKGVYNALNIGLDSARGDFIVILHAGDEMSSGYIQKLLARWEPGLVCFANRIFGRSVQNASEEISGYSLFHKNIIHNTFLVSRADFTRVGPFNTDYRILADHDWTQRARDHDLRFQKIDIGDEWYQMEAGGISTAKTPEDRDAFKEEWIRFQRKRYPRLPENLVWSIYEYRFNEQQLEFILKFLRATQNEIREIREPFLSELKSALVSIWEKRPILFATADARRRLEACEKLDVNAVKSNIRLAGDSGVHLALKNIVESAPEECELHIVPVNNSPTETFITDTVRGLRKEGKVQIVVCERNAPEDLSLNLGETVDFVLEVGNLTEVVATTLVHYLVQILRPTSIYAHWLISVEALDKAIDSLPQECSVLLMAYGVDVTDLEKEKAKALRIQDRYLSRAGVGLVAPSKHLRSRLLAIGFTTKKTFVVHPAISIQPEIRAPRGPDSRIGPPRLRLLNTGRLVTFKRQEDILDAIAVLRERGLICELTILAGSRLDRLNFINSRIEELALQDSVQIVEHASRKEVVKHLEQADIYVSSARANKVGDAIHTETFGVALAEALVAGLPVVTSLEGGQSEVIEGEGGLAKGYPAGNISDLADCIHNLFHNYPSLRERKATSSRASSRFSMENRVRNLEAIQRELIEKSLRILHFSKTAYPGAGSGAFRLHKAMLAEGIHSTFVSLNHSDRDSHSKTLSGTKQIKHPSPFHGNTIFSVDSNPISSMPTFRELVKSEDVFIVHLFRDLLSVEDLISLARTGKPVFCVVRDYSAISGGCHYPRSCNGWQSRCLPCPQFNHQDQIDLPLFQQEARKEFFRYRNVTAVFLSSPQAKKMAEAMVLDGTKTVVIPNIAPRDFQSPIQKAESRKKWSLPLRSKIVGIFSTYEADVKGRIWLTQNIKTITNTSTLVLVGNGFRPLAKKYPGIFWIPTIPVEKVAQLMKALDCVLIPSEEETFSNVALEAALSGVPVVGGPTGVIPLLSEMGLAATGPNDEWVDLINSANTAAHPEDFREKLMNHFSGELIVESWTSSILPLARGVIDNSAAANNWNVGLNDYRKRWQSPGQQISGSSNRTAQNSLRILRESKLGKFLRRKVPWRWRRRVNRLLSKLRLPVINKGAINSL